MPRRKKKIHMKLGLKSEEKLRGEKRERSKKKKTDHILYRQLCCTMQELDNRTDCCSGLRCLEVKVVWIGGMEEWSQKVDCFQDN